MMQRALEESLAMSGAGAGGGGTASARGTARLLHMPRRLHDCHQPSGRLVVQSSADGVMMSEAEQLEWAMRESMGESTTGAPPAALVPHRGGEGIAAQMSGREMSEEKQLEWAMRESTWPSADAPPTAPLGSRPFRSHTMPPHPPPPRQQQQDSSSLLGRLLGRHERPCMGPRESSEAMPPPRAIVRVSCGCFASSPLSWHLFPPTPGPPPPPLPADLSSPVASLDCLTIS